MLVISIVAWPLVENCWFQYSRARNCLFSDVLTVSLHCYSNVWSSCRPHQNILNFQDRLKMFNKQAFGSTPSTSTFGRKKPLNLDVESKNSWNLQVDLEQRRQALVLRRSAKIRLTNQQGLLQDSKAPALVVQVEHRCSVGQRRPKARDYLVPRQPQLLASSNNSSKQQPSQVC